MKSVFSMVRGSVFACVLGAAVTLSSAASARDSADPVECTSDGWGMVTCQITGGGGASTFLGAFASDNGGKGGWTEFYSDEDGEWWVEHHADGGTSVGWEANFISGPKMGNSEGSFKGKSRPSLKGKLQRGQRRTFAAAKAAAAKSTATLTSMQGSLNAQKMGQISLQGSGQCKAAFVVSKDGKVVSSTGIVPVTLPSSRAIALPSDAGNYVITVNGKDGCLGQTKSASVNVPSTPPRVIVRVAGR